MSRLIIHVEGQTEEDFVKEILAPHLYNFGFTSVSARLVGNSRQRDRRGGFLPWDAARQEIVRHLREDSGCFVSTMLDYYALPKSGSSPWPGRAAAEALAFENRASTVTSALSEDLKAFIGPTFNEKRFIPYITMHEFEGLLFSDCEKFGDAIGRPELIGKFQRVRSSYQTPEHINDSPITAPSKQIISIFPGYQKPLFGTLGLLGIGLEKVRTECPCFNNWLLQLESCLA